MTDFKGGPAIYFKVFFQGNLTNYSWFSRQEASGTKIERPWGILFSIIRCCLCLRCVGNGYHLLEFALISTKTRELFCTFKRHEKAFILLIWKPYRTHSFVLIALYPSHIRHNSVDHPNPSISLSPNLDLTLTLKLRFNLFEVVKTCQNVLTSQRYPPTESSHHYVLLSTNDCVLFLWVFYIFTFCFSLDFFPPLALPLPYHTLPYSFRLLV